MHKKILSLVLLATLGSFDPAGAEKAWWEIETKLNAKGELFLTGKPWWEKSQQMKVGDRIELASSSGDGGGRMLLLKENRQRGEGTMLVWILDDDGDMDGDDPQADHDSDCYLADYGCDGSVDRMVDFIDEDGDQVPDEMDIRYFVDGELRRSWFGTDYDGDGEMWDLLDWEYTGDFFKSDPYGNNEIYMNKYNPHTQEWVPISECPFVFYDTNNDSHSDRVIRFSASPLQFNPETDPDYANSQARYQGEWDPTMEEMGVMNIRYSFDIDDGASEERPLHYEMGFNLVGALKYEFEGMRRHQPLRRDPKTTVCVPYDQAIEVAESYPADRTGFTFREFEDSGFKIGHPGNPAEDRRWEGVFWSWHRRIMPNTGGPVQDWNVRREYRPAPSNEREVYYSPVDRRIHLKGATEGWLLVGHIGNREALAEVRYFDLDEDGYFDRWEYYLAGEHEPYRVSTVAEASNRDFGDDWRSLQKFYIEEALPDAISLNEGFIRAIEASPERDLVPPLPGNLDQALARATSETEKRYILDVIREFRFANVHRGLKKRAHDIEAKIPPTDPRGAMVVMKDSERAWNMHAKLAEAEVAYGRGDFKQVIQIYSALLDW